MRYTAILLLLLTAAASAQQGDTQSALLNHAAARIGTLTLQNDSLSLQVEELRAKLADAQALQARLSEAQERIRQLEAALPPQPTEPPK